MRVSIRYKLLPIIVIGVIAIATVFYWVSLQAQKSAREKQIADEIWNQIKIAYSDSKSGELEREI